MAWDESKHPRDGDGRFTDGNGIDTTRAKLKAVLAAGYELPLDKDGSLNTIQLERLYEGIGQKGTTRIPLDFFGGKKDYSNEPIPETPKEVFGFADKERKNTAHHIKHAREMGYKNQDEYERAALDFWKNSKGDVHYSRGRKRFYKYDGSRFVSFDTEGTLRTFMKMTQKDFERKKAIEKL